MSKTESQYDLQVIKFLERTMTNMSIEFLKHDYHFSNDKEKRDIYKITLSNKHHKYSFNFGNSLKDSGLFFKGVPEKFKIPNGSPSKIERIKHDNRYHETRNKKGFRKEPTFYSVLACLSPMHEETFEDFCDSFGYETDSISAKRTYEACIDEDRNLRKLFDRNELEMLAEIN